MHLNILAPDKTRIFSTPIYNPVVRTGVIGDGSCFFHCVAFALYKEYKKYTLHERTEFVNNLREQVVQWVSLDRLKLLGNGEIYKMYIIDMIRAYNKKLMDSDTFSKWDHDVLSNACNKWKSIDIHDFNIQLYPTINDDVVLEFKNYVSMNWVDNIFLELLQNFFECNFYFVDAYTRTRYTGLHLPNIYDTNIIICWLQESHYECLGIPVDIDSNRKTTRVQRVFDSEHPIIKNLDV